MPNYDTVLLDTKLWGTTKRDAMTDVPGSCSAVVPCRAYARLSSGPDLVRSGERWLAVQDQHVLVVLRPSGKRVVFLLEPRKLGFQVTNTLLETAHLRDHSRIGTADVAE